ncbi:hypothetical protein WJ78_17760 [Burkholderia ubonensis]|uniref:patatin-like phospholipase family protein n=1 Tax=Burkholderia ubonensis TaxID=101571 RepID=UPI000756EC83|nr:patatin-like phospholipase family protein [Burkholderia ubonensis]KVO64968.1 hypothetical protein WJ78_17760 [Burkholderia ubonensis]KVP89965.1 hypothetical protein WJ97_23555 [Burkholderia ubonensis]KWK89345.1 hypothetical protein WM19_27675 [Burkholderia ubonensis]KWK97321.1 hypothetical protein WM20_17455 [Burkholderia ubonensis]KWN37564.1 hypothetical protein WM22_14515 [Burkholderia ubonensis]
MQIRQCTAFRLVSGDVIGAQVVEREPLSIFFSTSALLITFDHSVLTVVGRLPGREHIRTLILAGGAQARASASISIVFAPVAVAGGSMVDGGTCNNMPVNDLTALDSLSGASIVRVPNGYASSFDRHMPVATRQRLYGDG